MPSWPGSLPENLLLGSSIQDEESRLISSMDAGPPTKRNRFTAITKTISGEVILKGAQLDTFLTFFRTTLSNGALAFDWKYPVDDSTVTMSFKNKPEWTCIKPNPDPDLRLWKSNFVLEVQP